MIIEKKVYCIIVTYNGMQWIKKCLDSLIFSTYKNNIIVVDNYSTDLTITFIKRNYLSVQLIESKTNLGFGQGNNIGLNIAIEKKADHILLLNQDAYLEEDTIYKLVKAQTENPQFGIISPLHLNGSGNDFDRYFYDYLNKSDIKSSLIAALLTKSDNQFIINTQFVNAAAWLISNDCLNKTGGFDPIFFHYGEDDHYINRAIFKGYKIGILSNARIYHDRERASVKEIINIRQKFKKDWIIFLNQACDIRHAKYLGLIIRRFLRYSLLTIVGIITFNKNSIIYNFLMAKNIVLSFFKIIKSRKICRSNKTPYLKISSLVN